MARWTEKDYQDFLKKTGKPNAPAEKKRGRTAKVARMSEDRFDEILSLDPLQGRAIRFHLDIPPLPKRSARVSGVRNGKIFTYIPKPSRRYMDQCKLMASLAMRAAGQPVYRLSVRMDIIFCFPGEDNELPTHPSDGDLDNLEKALYDGLSKVVCEDDRLVSGHENFKICVADQAKIIVMVSPLRPSEMHLSNLLKGVRDVEYVEFSRSTDASQRPIAA